jgi:phosphonate metabolism protein PhnN/1,5-bisphosphokinase (PRPP-forming)
MEQSMLVLVVGPSGAGKDTLLDAARRALADDARFRFVRREITRPASAGGEQHLALDSSAFAARRDAGAYALHWGAHGLGYGIAADIDGDLAAGRVVIASVSRTVIAGAAERFPVRVLEITAPASVLAERLRERARESEADIALRLARTVSLPAAIETIVIMNDGTPEQGAARLVAALRAAAASAPSARTRRPASAG